MKFSAALLASFVAVSSATMSDLERKLEKTGTGACKVIDLDFNDEFFAMIDYVDHELLWEELGLRITVQPKPGCKQTLKPRIFNTVNPICQDPNKDAGLFEGTDLGKALIINTNELCENAVSCEDGGSFKFEFKQRVELQDISVLDGDAVSITGTHLLGGAFDMGSVSMSGDGSFSTFPLNKKNVIELIVNASGSTALNNLKYIKCDGGVNGDPHFQTWTGYKFDYHGQCDLALVSAPNHNDNEGLDIQVRTTQRDFYSYISAVAMKLGDSTMEVTYDGILVDGELAKLEGVTDFTFQGYHATFDDTPSESGRKQTVIEVQTGAYEHITIKIFDKYMAVRVWNPEFKNFLGARGLMGDYNTDKLLGRDGSVFESTDLFSEHWQVNDSDPKLFTTTQEPQYPTMCVPAPKMNTGRKLRHGITESKAQEACANAADLEDCVFDIMATGDLHIAGAHEW